MYETFDQQARAIPYDRNNVRRYREQVAAVNAAFRDALIAECNLDNHPTTASKVWEMAWDQGHANGYSEVENAFYDLVELVEVVLREVA